ncbi:MAG: ABC transporter ATP-binding protein [Chloroflexi bacterium]|nr:ABC transporter ATP-binding protein [Chloroflexota bacterium]
MASDPDTVLEVKDLHTHFTTREGTVKAVNGVSFTLRRGRVLAVVGESGCGKTVTALSLLGLVPAPGRVVRGQALYHGRDLLAMPDQELRRIRGKEIAMVLQAVTAGLNPIITVGDQVQETFTTHLSVSKKEARRLAEAAMRRAGLHQPKEVFTRYPFQLSGGMCQRVMLAMALALDPQVLIADEATSALDMTLQAQVLEQLRRLQREKGCSIILITHDMGVVAQMADDVVVMYAGCVVERTDTRSLFSRPLHPYTWGLLQALPRMDRQRGPLPSIRGTPPSLLDPPDQCPFLPRCHKAVNECRIGPNPILRELEQAHVVACYNPIAHT